MRSRDDKTPSHFVGCNYYQIKKAGFVNAPREGKGSHTALYTMDDSGKKLLVFIPRRDPVPKGTLISLLKQANLTREEIV